MPEYTLNFGAADSGFSPGFSTQTKLEYTRPIRPGSRPYSRANCCTRTQSPFTCSGVEDECGTHVSAYFAMRLSTGVMSGTVWPYTFSLGWVPPPIQMGGCGSCRGFGSTVRC